MKIRAGLHAAMAVAQSYIEILKAYYARIHHSFNCALCVKVSFIYSVYSSLMDNVTRLNKYIEESHYVFLK
jgi:hypothetical protein